MTRTIIIKYILIIKILLLLDLFIMISWIFSFNSFTSFAMFLSLSLCFLIGTPLYTLLFAFDIIWFGLLLSLILEISKISLFSLNELLLFNLSFKKLELSINISWEELFIFFLYLLSNSLLLKSGPLEIEFIFKFL